MLHGGGVDAHVRGAGELVQDGVLHREPRVVEVGGAHAVVRPFRFYYRTVGMKTTYLLLVVFKGLRI